MKKQYFCLLYNNYWLYEDINIIYNIKKLQVYKFNDIIIKLFNEDIWLIILILSVFQFLLIKFIIIYIFINSIELYFF